MNQQESPSLPTAEQLRAGVAANGHGFNEKILAATRDLYRPSVQANLSTKNKVTQDLAYGPAERHRLDVYQGAGLKLPVVVYVHGGGYVGGNKRSDDMFYGNIGHYFANAGCVAVIMNYRLAPADVWPAGPQDIASAMEWVAANIEGFGGDPRRVTVFGQSAGATHSSSYLFDPDFAAHASAHLKSAILFNGVYRVVDNPTGGMLAYFGADASAHARRSPLSHVASSDSKVPLMIAVAELDPPIFVAQGYALAQAVTLRDGRSPVFFWMEGHNHVSNVLGLGSAQDDVGQRLLAFLKKP